MTQPDGKSQKTPATSAASKETPKNAGTKKVTKADKIWIGSILFLLLLLAAASFLARNAGDTPPPVVSADEEEDFAIDEESAIKSDPDADVAEMEAEPESESADVTTGALVITADVTGAAVYLNGKRVGKTPHKATPLAPGTYKVKVSQPGYEDFEATVDVEAETRTVRADLKKAASTSSAVAMLKVDSNVSGATVALDGKERGTTPLEIEKLEPGTHELVVSAAGYKTHSEKVEYAGGARNIRVELEETGAVTLNEAVAVKHKHRLGGCEGVLRATSDGIRFDTDHKDAFFVAMADLERMELDGDELKIKVQGGRNYNFEERNDNDEALARFHERVDEALAR